MNDNSPQSHVPVNLEDEIRKSYLDYAMSVIIGRALPDARDGLKPVHRRILYGMHELGNTSTRAYKKCARIVGDVIGKYHPHGDTAVYDALVRMAQDFSLRYVLVDGQGNFGSIDGDPPAAYRYTEARMERIAEEMLADVDRDTVDFVPNYDNAEKEPTVLPARIPALLVNGSSGIAVGMATNIPPHNLTEIVNAAILLVKNPEATLDDLMGLVPGPDFPTAGFIYGRRGIRAAYETGRGIIQMRARAGIEELAREREAIVITEIPYQVNKAKLIEKIAELTQDKRLEDISDIRDESDREGMRIVVELKRDAQPQIVLNNLYKLTAMQSSFGVIMLAIVGGQPKVLTLKEALSVFIMHRRDVVMRRTAYDLAKAEARAHILAGLTKALDHLDMVLAIIRGSRQPAEARVKLMERFEFTALQAEAILEMRLQRLTGLERDKIVEEYESLLKQIAEYRRILTDDQRLKEVVIKEFEEVRTAYGDQRRTEIVDETGEIQITDLVPDEEVVVTISHSGYIKRTPASVYRSQGRGGKGRMGMTSRSEDFIEHMFVVSTHSYILIFTNKGRVYWLKAYEIPDLASAGKGKSIINLVNMDPDEKLADVVSVRDFEDGKFVMMATRNGTIKKTGLPAFSNPRSAGIIAITLDEGDELIAVKPTDGSHEVLLATRDGMAVRFNETGVRDMGRGARGVRGASLRENDFIVAMETFKEHGMLLVVTDRGYGKRTSIEEYRLTARGGKGVINIKTGEKNGHVVDAVHVTDDDGVLLITAQGKLIRLQASDIRQTVTRSALGVKLIDLEEGDYVTSVAIASGPDEEPDLVM
ncbi:MAG: DNA gyrase subunit A [Acidobacteria bacterium]|nr:DNA gyrase subunit A [Acidobacteriota bacterium]MBI3654856.1 DNA gyrase subunit A [Acidobacteriota bacterium]